jgi:photosystem II stability/assembly factor-like uncharacterized protein
MSASTAVQGTDDSSGGPPRFVALATLEDGTLLAGTRGRGLVRSGDGGATWSPPSVPPDSGHVFSFYSSGNSELLAATGSGISRSLDGAQTWRSLGPDGTLAYDVVRSAHELVAATESRGIMVSADDGRTWTSASDEIAGCSVFRLLALDDDELLVGTEAGLWRVRRDGGRLRPTRAALEGLAIYALACVNSGTLLAGTRGEGVARSLDGGGTWRFDGGELADPVVTCLHVDATGVYAGTGRGVARSTDEGRTWAPLGAGLDNYRIFSLATPAEAALIAGSYESVWLAERDSEAWHQVDTGLVRDARSISLDSGGEVFAGASDGLLRSDDAGESWSFAGDGMGPIGVHGVIRLSSGDLLAATDTSVFRACDESLLWKEAGLCGRRVRCVLEVLPDVLLAGTVGSGLFGSEDGGATWRSVDTGFSNPMVMDIVQDDRGVVFMATGDPTGHAKTGAVLRSEDAGRSWTCASDVPLTSYRAVRNSSGTIFVAAQRCKVLRSRDGGTTWDLLDTTGLVDAKVWALAVDAGDRVFLGTAQGLLVSTDDAETWTMVDDTGLEGVTVYDVKPHPSGTLVAATNVGVLRSVDGGESWS